MKRCFQALALLVCLSCLPVQAVILYDGDNTATTTDPGTGVPFGNVVGVYNATGGQVGTAVYLQNGYFITADHVPVEQGYTFSFDGTTFHSIDTAQYAPAQIGTGDVKLFYAATPELALLAQVDIYTSTLAVNGAHPPGYAFPEVTVVGAGVGRAAGSALGSGDVVWGGANTCDIRWGTNAIEALIAVNSGSYAYNAYVSINDDPGNPNSTGATEAAMAMTDSGGGIFYYDETAQQWFLLAIATSVSDNDGVTYFYDSGSSDINACLNFYLSLADFASQIDAIVSVPIPEPSAAWLVGLAAIGAVCARRRR